jgi:hypothetical protein
MVKLSVPYQNPGGESPADALPARSRTPALAATVAAANRAPNRAVKRHVTTVTPKSSKWIVIPQYVPMKGF